MEENCPICKTPVQSAYFFCPNCGRQLHEKTLSISAARQIGFYLLSFLLPPFGLWPAFKYLHQKDKKAQTVGVVGIVLTVISIGLTILLAMNYVNQLSQQINQINSLQMPGY
jgi:hypothetical protein